MYLEYQVKRSEFYYFYSRQWKVNNGFCTGKGYDRSDFCHHHIILFVMEFHILWLIQSILFYNWLILLNIISVRCMLLLFVSVVWSFWLQSNSLLFEYNTFLQTILLLIDMCIVFNALFLWLDMQWTILCKSFGVLMF